MIPVEILPESSGHRRGRHRRWPWHRGGIRIGRLGSADGHGLPVLPRIANFRAAPGGAEVGVRRCDRHHHRVLWAASSHDRDGTARGRGSILPAAFGCGGAVAGQGGIQRLRGFQRALCGTGGGAGPGAPYRSGRSLHWIKVKTPNAPAATRVRPWPHYNQSECAEGSCTSSRLFRSSAPDIERRTGR